ncbi:MAG TPA: acyl-CoA dehydrogenase C-terminal domain-containing protein [Thermoanaerobaculia bacterium]|nr:acyl-CoA dehydrogenase C-terminal domain-containing protein [Thermoanaerobaculia bacterium]
MPTYKAPLRDLRFVYYELFDGAALTRLPGFEEASPELVMDVVAEVGRFSEEVLLPLNASGDREGCRFENGAVVMPQGFREAYKTFREGGWTGLTARPEYGGQGLPYAVGIMATEVLCAANLAFSMVTALSHGAYAALDRHATAALKAAFLPRLVDGTWAATMCLTEPQAGTDLGLLRMRAEPAGDGAHRLTGSKIFISGGDHDLTENIVHLVLARLPDAPPGIKGISLFVIPKLREEGGRLVPNGVSCGAIEHKMGIKASPTCVIDFDGATGYLVGEAHKGMKAMFTFMNGARLHVGVQGLALAEAAYQAAVKFARERLQGRALGGARSPGQEADPILVHPDVRRMLLTIRAFVEGARALTAWAAFEIDHADSDPDPERAMIGDDMASLLTPIVKAFQTDLGFEMTNHAVQVCGGYGYTVDYGVEQLVRDCRITQIYEGTNGVQALDLVGRKLPAHTGRYLRRFFHPVQELLAAEAGNPELAELVGPVAKAFERLQQATAWLARESLGNPDQAGAAATDYLHLFGYVALGYLWVRMAKVALAKRGGAGTAFYDAKLATARFYVRRVLPRSGALFATVMAGSGAIMEFPDSAF